MNQGELGAFLKIMGIWTTDRSNENAMVCLLKGYFSVESIPENED